MGKQGKALFQSIADKLLDDIEASGRWRIPSIVELANQYHVSARTMWKALRILADRGIIRSHRGRRAVVTKQDQNLQSGAVEESSCRVFYEKLKSRITEGSLRTGEILPKVYFFARNEHVSKDTVTGALRILAHEKMVYKEGKKWIVGPAGLRSAGAVVSLISHNNPVIILLTSNPETFNKYWLTRHMTCGPFVQNFTQEVERHGVILMRAYTRKSADEPGIPGGLDEVRNLASQLGARCIGALLMMSHQMSEVEMHEWLDFFTQREKNIIFLGLLTNQPYVKRQALRKKRHYAYVEHPEYEGVTLALTTLHELGHRTIGMPLSVSFQDEWSYVTWEGARAELIARQAPVIIPSVNILFELYNDAAAGNSSRIRSDPISWISAFSRRNAAENVDSYRRMSTIAPPLASVLDGMGCSAIIALNDYFSRIYYDSYCQRGVRIPGQISIIGFDNDMSSRFYPLSTIDWGFDRFGYLAAHFIIGDIPVKTETGGKIPPQCVLIDRGSLGTPPNG